MSVGDRVIVCGRCGEIVSLDIDNCPHCGAKVTSIRMPVAALIFGLVLIVPSLFSIGDLWPFTLIGLVLAFGGGYFLFDRRQRIRRAIDESVIE